MQPRFLPRVADDVVHILVGRRVVTVPLPPRGPRGSWQNFERAFIVREAFDRLAARERR